MQPIFAERCPSCLVHHAHIWTQLLVTGARDVALCEDLLVCGLQGALHLQDGAMPRLSTASTSTFLAGRMACMFLACQNQDAPTLPTAA